MEILLIICIIILVICVMNRYSFRRLFINEILRKFFEHSSNDCLSVTRICPRIPTFQDYCLCLTLFSLNKVWLNEFKSGCDSDVNKTGLETWTTAASKGKMFIQELVSSGFNTAISWALSKGKHTNNKKIWKEKPLDVTQG